MSNIHSLIPEHKTDLERAEAAIAAGYPQVAPILPDLLVWLQDYNWPVAHALAPFLTSIGSPLIPHIRPILDSEDEIWKYWVISIILHESPEVAAAFREDLERLAYSSTEFESSEGLDELAKATLHKYGWATNH